VGRDTVRHATAAGGELDRHPDVPDDDGIPTWAIVCAVVFFFLCLLGLLFLLAKEERTTGHMQVTVQAPGFFHMTYVPVTSPMQANDVAGRVNYARALPV
jgi:hypothetical protein